VNSVPPATGSGERYKIPHQGTWGDAVTNAFWLEKSPENIFRGCKYCLVSLCEYVIRTAEIHLELHMLCRTAC